MYKHIILMLGFAVTGSCCAMQESVGQDSLMSLYRSKLSKLKTELARVKANTDSFPTLQPNIRRVVMEDCLLVRADIIAQAQKAHIKIARVSVTMAREFTNVINQARRLRVE